MSQLERLYRIEQMLLNGGPVSTQQLLDTLEISPATLKRDIAYLRDRLHVPLVFDRYLGGYTLEQPRQGQKRHALPGLWFSAQEAQALLTMHKLLSDLDTGGLLGPHIAPLLERITTLLGTELGDAKAVMDRIGLQMAGQHRKVVPQVFEVVSTALLRNKRLRMNYHSRYSDSTEVREVSPQRLTYYKDNWYLAAYCHTREALRVFSLDGMADLVTLETDSTAMDPVALKEALNRGYGIYNGGELQHAVLEFDASSARWVQDQCWHPDQRNEMLPDGRLRVTVPYQNSIELVVDILSWGEFVKVCSPASLLETVQSKLTRAIKIYQDHKNFMYNVTL